MLQPLVTEALLRRLAEVFPGAPTRSMTQREIDHWIGQREVLDYVASLHKTQADEPLDLEAF
ncbi:MAG: hypothetical protein VKI42_01035 [Synechococcaceae cyanobacterium]|nr:hypothetical protein [Synechococcaceae cyanobacterium]